MGESMHVIRPGRGTLIAISGMAQLYSDFRLEWSAQLLGTCRFLNYQLTLRPCIIPRAVSRDPNELYVEVGGNSAVSQHFSIVLTFQLSS